MICSHLAKKILQSIISKTSKENSVKPTRVAIHFAGKNVPNLPDDHAVNTRSGYVPEPKKMLPKFADEEVVKQKSTREQEIHKSPSFVALLFTTD